jgi:glycerophosphoryl diester phosphodiesterase
MDMIEIDVQQTADHRFVIFHDLDVEPKTDGTGTFPVLTADQALAMNVADNDKWRGSAYDPSRMPTLEEVLALAAKHGVGIMFDLKESVTDAASVALMAQAAGVVPRSVFIPYVPARAEAIKAAVPDALLNFSTQGFSEAPGGVTPGILYAYSHEYGQFGSSIPDYPAERIAEVHDGCGIVVPNVYQGDITGSEAGDLAYARSIGADGAQVNSPDVAADVLDRPVPTRLVATDSSICLVDGLRGLGLPGKPLRLGDGATLITGRGGCVAADGPAGRVRFAGDGSALASTVVASPGH